MADEKILAIKYPIFGIDWKRDSVGSPFIAIAGGGGASKSGIKNCVTLVRVRPAPDLASKPSMNTFLEIDTKDRLVSGVSIGSKGGLLAMTIGNRTAIYRIKEGKEYTASFILDFQTDFAEEDSYQNVVKFNYDGTQVASGGEDGVVRLWKLTIPPLKPGEDVDGKYKKAFKVADPILLNGHSGCITGISWHSSGTKIVTCAKDGQCILWINVSNKWKKAVSLGLAGELAIQNNDKMKNKGKFVYRSCHFNLTDDIDENSTALEIMTAQTPLRGSSYITKWICILDTKKGKASMEEIKSIRMHETIVCSMSISNHFIACGTSDGKLFIYRYNTMDYIKSIEAHYLPSTGISFFPSQEKDQISSFEFTDDMTLISASADYSLYLVSGHQPSKTMYIIAFLAIVIYFIYFFHTSI